MGDSNIFDQVVALLDTLTESITKSQDRLEAGQVDIYKHLHSQVLRINKIDTQTQVLHNTLETLRTQLETLTTTQTTDKNQTTKQMQDLALTLEALNTWVTRQKAFSEFEKAKEETQFKAKLIAVLIKISQLGAAGAAGGGIWKLLS